MKRLITVLFLTLSASSFAGATTLPRTANVKFDCQLSTDQNDVEQQIIELSYDVATRRFDGIDMVVAQKQLGRVALHESDSGDALNIQFMLGRLTDGSFDMKYQAHHAFGGLTVGNEFRHKVKTGWFGQHTLEIHCSVLEVRSSEL